MGRAVVIPKFGTVTFGSPNVKLEVETISAYLTKNVRESLILIKEMSDLEDLYF